MPSFLTSSLFKNSSIYIITDGISQAIPFLLLPLISHYLSPADYGIITNFNVLFVILSIICFMTTAGVLPVIYYKKDKEALRLYISNMLFLNTIVTVGCLVMTLIFNRTIDHLIQLPLFYQILCLVTVWFASITNLNMILWRCEERPWSFGKYKIALSSLNIIITIWFVVILLWGWQGRVYSQCIAIIVFGAISLWILIRREYFVLKISKQDMLHVLFFALPLLPHALSFWLKSGINKIYLTDMCSLSENGLYSVALTWGGALSMFFLAFNNAYAPYLYKKLSFWETQSYDTTYQDKIRLVKMTYICLLGTLLISFLAYWVSLFIIKLTYAPSYFASIRFLPWAIMDVAFNGCYWMFVCFLYHTLKTKLLGAITFSLSIAQIGLSYVSILWLGSTGVAISAAFISFITFIIIAYVAMRSYRLPWGLKCTNKTVS